jgi:hypothetical protein
MLCAIALPLATAHAQTKQPAPPARSAAQPAPAAPSAPPLTPAAPAAVKLANGQLTVSAQNSDLTAILQQVARTSGMSIEGLGKTTRVFGVYGPGSPRDILTELLAGSDYNFVMLGGGTGSAPARLVLSEKPTGPQAPANATQAANNDIDDADSDDADQEPLGPGAIPHPSPQFIESTDPQIRAQQNLQRLQQMHEQMMQQQQQQDNPQ